MVGMGFVGGIGFTVSLLVGELSFGVGSESDNRVKVGVLAGSLIAAAIGAAILSVRNHHYDHHAQHAQSLDVLPKCGKTGRQICLRRNKSGCHRSEASATSSFTVGRHVHNILIF
jgi:hypothetical protein